MVRTLSRILLVALGLAAVIAAVGYTLRETPVGVTGHAVGRGPVEFTVANTRAGTVRACRRARISPQIGGVVTHLPVERGDRVQAGDLLMELWSEDLQARHRLAQDELRVAQAEAEATCLAADLAQRDAQRAVRLHGDAVLGEQARDRAEAERETSRAACRAAGERIEQALSQTRVAEVALSQMVLHAPFAGVIAELDAELGEVVTPSPPGIPTPAALDLIEEGCLYVVAPLDEVDAPRVQLGQKVRVNLDAFPDRVFAGTVRRVAPFVRDREKQARTVDVEVDIDDPEAIPGLLPGYSADVEVLLERRDDVLRVPTEALIEERAVLVVGEAGLERRSVECGLSNWQFTEVLSGLRAGETVVVSLGREGVEAGARVVVEPESAR